MAEDDDENPISEIKRAIDAQDGSALLAAAEDCHYADLAELYEHLDDGERESPPSAQPDLVSRRQHC